jgi:hypothetical protein
MPWFKLTGDERITLRCATDDCAGQVTERLEADGVGANYCLGCRLKIEDHRRAASRDRMVGAAADAILDSKHR